jgi:hypothetical protein
MHVLKVASVTDGQSGSVQVVVQDLCKSRRFPVTGAGICFSRMRFDSVRP